MNERGGREGKKGHLPLGPHSPVATASAGLLMGLLMCN